MTTTLGDTLAIGLQRFQVGDLAGAEYLLRQVLEADPLQPDALHYVGMIAFQSGQSDLAIDYMKRSLAISPTNERAHCNLGVALQSAGKLVEASQSYRQALQLRPDYPEALSNLAFALTEQGQHAEAVACCQRALEIRPDYAQGHTNLAVALQALGILDEATAHCREAVNLRPDLPEAHNTLGTILFLQGKDDQAERCYKEALRLRPRDPKAHGNLAAVWLRAGKLDEAEAEIRTALADRPNYSGARLNLGSVLLQRGNISEAAACYRAVSESDHPTAHSNLLMCLNYDADISDESLFEAHRAWGARHANASEGSPALGPNRDPERRLRLGYVSPDLRAHTVAAFLRPILANHDRTQVEAICYAEVTAPDAVTSNLMSLADGWRNIHGLSDAQAAELIRTDGIDILVDLAGHTADNRLLTFARKPAPVQVSYLGYPYTTGLEAVDYYLTDAVCDPAGESGCYTEEVFRLPSGFCCYDAPALARAVGPLPAKQNGFITFGSFHHLGKLNDGVLDLWAELLRVVPSARLLIFRHTLQGSVREMLLGRLRQRGVDPSRVEMRHAPDPGTIHLDMYGRVDISLDVFPWSGHTTACESLWMGVPVVTLRGARHAGRMVASVLTSAGLLELIADAPEQYVEIAARLAGDVEALSTLRAGLRERVRTSALCDGKSFSRDLEAAYREMWRRVCV